MLEVTRPSASNGSSHRTLCALVVLTLAGCSSDDEAVSGDGGSSGGAGAAAGTGGKLAATGGSRTATGGTRASTGGAAGGTGAGGGGTGGVRTGTGGTDADASTDVDAGAGGSGGAGPKADGFVFSPYKDTGIDMNWNTNVVSTKVSGSPTPLATDLKNNHVGAITLAFATGECGSENWAGVPGAIMASANVPLLTAANVRYIVSTGGAAGSFTCGTDSGFTTFLSRWSSANLIGVDFDIEAGQTDAQVADLVHRIQSAHGSHPTLRFSLTLATLGNNDGSSTAKSLGSAIPSSFNAFGDEAMAAVKSVLGFSSPSTWPTYLTVNLMTMDYGAVGAGVCVVSGGKCQMAQSAIQAAYNLHDRWGVPYENIELTPMLGQNDTPDEQFTLDDVKTVMTFVESRGLAGVHHWSYDRDVDCAKGSASSTCNSMGAGYSGAYGYSKAFVAAAAP